MTTIEPTIHTVAGEARRGSAGVDATRRVPHRAQTSLFDFTNGDAVNAAPPRRSRRRGGKAKNARRKRFALRSASGGDGRQDAALQAAADAFEGFSDREPGRFGHRSHHERAAPGS